jgi:hypothetical protein
MKLKYQCEDRFAETMGYDGFEADKEELYHFFETKVKPKFDNHDIVGMDHGEQTLYHVCYDCNMELWQEIWERVANIGEKCEVKIDWEEIKHLMKFTFMYTRPWGTLPPHTAHNLRALSAFNIPLVGRTEVILYDRKSGKNLMFPGSDIYEYARHEYTNPCFLNVNKLHGVENKSDEPRIILKSHMLITTVMQLIRATEGDTTIQQLQQAPWLETKFKRRLWLGKKKTASMQ